MNFYKFYTFVIFVMYFEYIYLLITGLYQLLLCVQLMVFSFIRVNKDIIIIIIIRANKSRLVLVLLLIGRESGARFF